MLAIYGHWIDLMMYSRVDAATWLKSILIILSIKHYNLFDPPIIFYQARALISLTTWYSNRWRKNTFNRIISISASKKQEIRWVLVNNRKTIFALFTTWVGAEMLALKWRTLAALLQDPASVPMVHIAISRLPGIQNPFLAPMGTRHTHGTWTCMHIQ